MGSKEAVAALDGLHCFGELQRGGFMKQTHFVKTLLGAVVCIFLTTVCVSAYGAKTIPVGATVPKFNINMPDDPKVKEYLGLKDGTTFTLSDIPAKLVIVEFFSAFCPVCQSQAPNANKIYKVITESPELSKDIKMLALALGNKPYEVGVFQKNFKVLFPLFPDPKKTIQEGSGVESIPLTLVIDKDGKVLASHLGRMKDLDEFLKEVRELQKAQ